MRFSRNQKTLSGFTLSELLIALAILGVIATFTIPKVLGAQQNQKFKALARETAAAIEQIVYTGRLTGAFPDSTSYKSYFMSKLNAIKVCPNDANGEGCWNVAAQGNYGGEEYQPGVILSSGVELIGIDPCCYGVYDGMLPDEGDNGLFMDVNGSQPPNVLGQDQYYISVCYGKADCTTFTTNRSGRTRIDPDIYSN